MPKSGANSTFPTYRKHRAEMTHFSNNDDDDDDDDDDNITHVFIAQK